MICTIRVVYYSECSDRPHITVTIYNNVTEWPAIAYIVSQIVRQIVLLISSESFDWRNYNGRSDDIRGNYSNDATIIPANEIPNVARTSIKSVYGQVKSADEPDPYYPVKNVLCCIYTHQYTTCNLHLVPSELFRKDYLQKLINIVKISMLFQTLSGCILSREKK